MIYITYWGMHYLSKALHKLICKYCKITTMFYKKCIFIISNSNLQVRQGNQNLQLAHELQSLHVHFIIVRLVKTSCLTRQNTSDNVLLFRTFYTCFCSVSLCFSSGAYEPLLSRESSHCRVFLGLLNKQQSALSERQKWYGCIPSVN